jgi:hypothetical protein
MATKGTSSAKLTKNTDGYRAIFDKVRELWDRYGSDITLWPESKELYAVLEPQMAPYGEHHNIRSAKLRNCYNKLTKEIFISHGEFITCSFIVLTRRSLRLEHSETHFICSLLLTVAHRIASSRSFTTSEGKKKSEVQRSE